MKNPVKFRVKRIQFWPSFLHVSGFIILALIASCSKDDFSPDLEASPGWEPEVALSLAYAEIGISDLAHVNDSNTSIHVGSDQFCTLIYQGNIFDVSADQLIQVPDQIIQNQFSLNSSEILTLTNTGQVQISSSQDFVFSTSQGVELDSLILKNSQLQLNLSSSFPADVEVSVTIPKMIKNGMAFNELVTINYNGISPVVSQRMISLDGYHLDLTKQGTTSNTLEVLYTTTVHSSGQGISTVNSIQYDLAFQSLQFKTLYGYFGQQTLGNLMDSIAISIYNSALGSGSFSIMDPKIRFDIYNSIGVPFNARISQLKALNANMTDFTVATGIPDPIPVNTPSINQVGETMHSSFLLNTSNSNINSMINEQPKYIIVASQVSTNPGGHTVNFLTDSSRLAMDAHVELPLYGTARDFRIKDTVPFHYNDLNKVEKLTLRINVENWFPIEAGIQLIFTDNNYLPLDTVFVRDEVIIPSGIISGSNERVTMAGTKIQDQVFDESRIAKIMNAEHIIVDAGASTSQQGSANVKIFNDYQLKLKFGAIAKMKIQ